MRLTDCVEVTGRIIRETDNAMLFRRESTPEAVWVPLSQVFEIHRHREADKVVLSKWIAGKKELM